MARLHQSSRATKGPGCRRFAILCRSPSRTLRQRQPVVSGCATHQAKVVPLRPFGLGGSVSCTKRSVQAGCSRASRPQRDKFVFSFGMNSFNVMTISPSSVCQSKVRRCVMRRTNRSSSSSLRKALPAGCVEEAKDWRTAICAHQSSPARGNSRPAALNPHWPAHLRNDFPRSAAGLTDWVAKACFTADP